MTGLKSLIKTAFQWAEQNNPEYLDGIINRKTGSQWDGKFEWQQLVNCPWQVLEPYNYVDYVHQLDCLYLYLLLDEASPQFLRGVVNIKELRDFVPEQLDSIELVEGSHGLELVSTLVVPAPATTVWLIIGDAYKGDRKVEGEKMVWTAHPGNPTMSLKHIPVEWHWDGSVAGLWMFARDKNIPFAVKGNSNRKIV